MAKCHTKSLFGDDQPQSGGAVDGHVVRVAFENGADSVFDYLVADTLWPVTVGQRVEVPFGRKNKLTQAFVVAIVSEEEKAINYYLYTTIALIFISLSLFVGILARRNKEQAF